MKRFGKIGKFILCGALLLMPYLSWAIENPVTITIEEKEDGRKVFSATNQEAVPYTLLLDFLEYGDIITDKKVPFYTVIPANEKNLVILSVQSEKGKQGFFQYQSTQFLGDCLKAGHDNNHVYLVPFKHGTKQRVHQAYDGGVTHVGDSRYAVDIEMPEGTGVYSARAGIVAAVKEDSNSRGVGEKYATEGNYIVIYHADGSVANYGHLKKDGALVKKGDQVEAGVLIGLSGNTGRTNGPHLHFDVRVPDKKDCRSVTLPVKFLGQDGKAISLEPTRWYYATHPNQPAYQAIVGELLENKDYAQYQKVFKEKDKMEIRYEKIDSTYVYFAGNGYAHPIELRVTFTLENFVMSQENPIVLQVPAGQERFLCIIRPRPVKDPTDFQFKVRSSYKYEYREKLIRGTVYIINWFVN